MKLDEQQKKLVLQKAGRAKCQMCGSLDWWIEETIVAIQLPTYEEGTVIMGTGNSPSVQMVCKNCGHIALLSAKILGFVK